MRWLPLLCAGLIGTSPGRPDQATVLDLLSHAQPGMRAPGRL
jgi:hypothetical protein